MQNSQVRARFMLFGIVVITRRLLLNLSSGARRWLSLVSVCFLTACGTQNIPSAPAADTVPTQADEVQVAVPPGAGAPGALEPPAKFPADPNLIPKAQPGFTPSAQSQSADCLDLARELETLRGKPLRRSALEERYQAECKR